ncbi:MAG: hypothetical protein BWZ02_01163 [Lentisphaerae bacterium ADurb.BinA184]|nr:MAG: hypothetical protein BWZ02_01163 [Lentisphaerae bacterium ADurb.BinA184]
MGQPNHEGGPRRRVLTDVPRVGFYREIRRHQPSRGPEDIIVPSCMRAVMEYLGHPEYDYVHFVGVTGAGFYLNWKDGWHGDNTAIYWMVPFDEHMTLFAYAFESTGYAMDFAPLKGPGAIDEAEARRRIVASIDAGRPILSHGIVGPPETCVIAGYDDGGEVLIGWSFFQGIGDWGKGIESEPNGMFRKRNWYAEAFDLFGLGPRGEPPAGAAVRRRSLEWAVKVVRTAQTWEGRTHNGLAAYDAWAEHLLRDGEITPDGSIPPGSTEMPFNAHDDAAGQVAEGRYYASEYLIRVAQAELRMRAPLLKAAGCYAREHDLMWEVWECCGGNGRSPEHVKRFADPSTRRRIAGLIRAARREDEQAVAHIEAALSATR